jgi:glycosyltransferase involved in cell wall biosynthesis
MKVVFIVPYPQKWSPSQRFRFEQYLPLLKSRGIDYEIHSFLTPSNWRLFTKPGNPIPKLSALMTGLTKRFMLLLRVRRFDLVFIHRETLPIGPPVLEWLIAKGLHKKIIYDFDDAIWLTDRKKESPIGRLLRWRSKVAVICRLSHKISCGNAYLASFARQYNSNVVVNPTTIDMSAQTRQRTGDISSTITIGWTGTMSTLKYLDGVRNAVSRVMTKYPSVRFVVIADERPSFDWPTFTFKKWSRETEVSDLLEFDIGIMPLPDDEWSRGKCGFKALQYMSLTIPTIASPVGVNTDIITHGQDGLLASTEEEWIGCLGLLIESNSLRHELGVAGRRKVQQAYSVESNTNLFLALFE